MYSKSARGWHNINTGECKTIHEKKTENRTTTTTTTTTTITTTTLWPLCKSTCCISWHPHPKNSAWAKFYCPDALADGNKSLLPNNDNKIIIKKLKADRPLTRDTLNAPCLLANRQFQWTGNGHSQLPLAELGKPSPNIDLLHTTVSNGRA